MNGDRPGWWVREGRAALGLTRAELADEVGATEEIIAGFEEGRLIPAGVVLEWLREVLPEADPRS